MIELCRARGREDAAWAVCGASWPWPVSWPRGMASTPARSGTGGTPPRPARTAVRAESFSAFLAGGQAVWQSTAAPRIPSHLHIASSGGLLPEFRAGGVPDLAPQPQPGPVRPLPPVHRPEAGQERDVADAGPGRAPADRSPPRWSRRIAPALPTTPLPQTITPPPPVPEPTTWAGSILLVAAGMLWMLGESRRSHA